MAAVDGRTTDFGGCPARRTGAERNRNSVSTAATPQESNVQDLGTAEMAEVFIKAISEALTSNTYGIAGACTPSDGGVVFTNAQKQARLVPAPEFARLAAAYGNAATEHQKNALVECACRAYVGGAADVPANWNDAKRRLLPQLWTLAKIRQKQSTLPPGVILPYCGLHGEDDSTLYDVGVVLVCDFAPEDANNAPSLETVVLSKDVRNWSISWTDCLRSALDNLRQRTRRLEASSVFEKRWEHHPSGCGSTLWRDRYDAARCALLPSVVARRKREDGQPEPGAHVCVFAARGLALGSTSKNALGLCYLGDIVHTKIKPTGDMLSSQAYRLVKVKTAPGRHHPLVQKAGEGVTWKWLPYAPAALSGEFSLPTSKEEVEALLECIEHGRPCPVFGPTEDQRRFEVRKSAFDGSKAQGNASFQGGDWKGALQSYDRACKVASEAASDRMPLYPEEPRPLAAVHANAALCFMKLAEESEGKQREVLYAQALKRAMSSAEADGTYAKAHDRCAKCFEALGESEAAAESRKLYEACKASDDAVKNDARRAALAARQAKVDAIARRKAAMLRTDDARVKKPPPPPVPKENAKPASTFITLDGGAAMQDLGIFDAAPPTPGGLDLDGLGLSSSGLSSNFSPFGATSGLSMD